jgi:hypothetical protein
MWLKHQKLNEHEQMLLDMSDKEFDDYMLANYPKSFKNRYRTADQEIILPMNFGFEVGAGWRHVLDSLCSKLKRIEELTGYVTVFDQVKEKYGGARFYYHIEEAEVVCGDKHISGLIDDIVNYYEEYCDHVCEVLGTNVDTKIVSGRWFYGCGLEGFKKAYPDSPDRIKVAEEYVNQSEVIKKISDDLWILEEDDITKIKNIIDDRIKQLSPK